MPFPLSPTSDLWHQASTSSVCWLEGPDGAWSFQDFLQQADALGREWNLSADERVTLVTGTPVPTLRMLLAAWLHGSLVAPLNPAFPKSRQQELQQQIHANRSLAVQEEALLPASTHAQLPELNLERPATVVFTSGSSGTPKAAVLSLGNFLWNASGANAVMPLSAGDRWLLSLPLFHVGGLSIVFRTLLAGAKMVLPRGKELAEALRKQRITHVSLVPTQLQRLLGTPEGVDVLRSLKLILIGGAGIAPSLLRRCGELELPVQASYGSTEMASQIATGPLEQRHGQWRVAATLLPERELQIVEPASDGTGEIAVRGKTRFLGYQQQDGLRKPFDAEGWFRTGDLGRLENGVLEVRGRRDAMFISGGENVHPETVERAFLELPEVVQALVVPVEDEEFGARPIAFVEVPASAWAPNQWVHALRQTLAGFQVPDLFLPWPQDLTPGLKPRRPELVARAQPVYDRWALHRPLRRWLREHGLGWRPVWQVGSGQVFEVVHHHFFPEPRSCFVLAQTRQDVMDWLKALGPERAQLPWKPLSRQLNRRVEDVLEIVRLLADDLPPDADTALDLRTQEVLPLPQVTAEAPPVRLPDVKTHGNVTLVLPPQEQEPVAAEEQVLQLGAQLAGSSRFFLLRLLFRPEPTSGWRFLGWKVQRLREADGLERDQPFWDLTPAEEEALNSALLPLPWITPTAWSSANLPEKERHRRQAMNQHFKCDLREK